MPIFGGALIDLAAFALPELFAAAPEAAAFAAPEAAAFAAPEIAGAVGGGTLLPEILVSAGEGAAAGAPLDLLGGLGAGAGAGGIGDLIGGLGAGLVGPAAAGGLSPSGIVSGEFGALPSTAATGTTPYKIGSSPFTGGPTPLPTPAPGLGGGTSPTAPGAGGPANTVAPIPGDPTDFATLGPGAGSTGGPLDATAPTGSGAQPATWDLTGAENQVGGGAGNFFSKNANLLSLLGLGVGGQLLGPQISKALGLNKVPGSENLTNLAKQEGQLAQQQQQFGETLQQPIVTGQLPQGAEQSVQRALSDAITTIKSRYGSLGLSGSTMEADAISNAQQAANMQRFNIEQQMAQTGIQATSQATTNLGLEENIYNTILQASIQQDAQLGNAISNFAAAAGMGTALGQAKAA